MKRRIYLSALLIAVFLTVLIYGYQRYASPTRIAFVNYMDFMYDAIVQADDNRFIKTEKIPLEADTFEYSTRYDAMYLFAHGNVNLTDEQREQIRHAISKGTEIIYRTVIPDEPTNLLDPKQVKYVTDCLDNGGRKNYKRMLNYTRRVLDGKKLFVDPVSDPFILPDSYYFHLGDEEVFTSIDSYINFLNETGRYHPNGKNIVLMAVQFGSSSDKSFINQLVNGLENQGNNVFPTTAYGPDRLKWVEDIQPDMIIFAPHGRFTNDGGIEWLKKKNIPLLCPIIVFAPEEEWIASQQGMDGGMLSQSVTMPEIDGGVAPMAIAAQFKNERGLYVFNGIRKRVDTFLELTRKWLSLEDIDNADKKVAVFYYKEAGKNSMVAEGLELAPSILNLLRKFRDEGYTTGELPKTPDALADLIQEHGPVFGTYAKGAIAEFIERGNPVVIPTNEFNQLISDNLDPVLVEQLKQEYGEVPGDFMTAEKDGQSGVVVARVQFGNVVLIPVPPAGLGEDTVKVVHGVSTPPPYPYVGAYLWARKVFDADAIMHFGTHGSVEFTPWKQVALSQRDWPDALLAGTPHFYIYVISNVGEAMIAKRRSYAVINSHLTAPLTQSDIYGPLRHIMDLIGKIENTSHDMMREEYRKSIHKLVLDNDLDQDLDFVFREDALINDDQLNRVHHYIDELEHEKITHGLHVLGASYSDSEIDETVKQMTIDTLIRSRMHMDLASGDLEEAQCGESGLINQRYRQPAEAAIQAILTEVADPMSFISEDEKAVSELPAYKSKWLEALVEYRDALASVSHYQTALADSPDSELYSVINSLNAGYIAPQPGGDPVFNPEAVPTGRNLFSINAEQVPSPEAFNVAKKQIDMLLQKQVAKRGKFPQKIAFTLWGGEFVRQEGLTIAQILYALGVEPLRNRRGTVYDVKLIPIEELGRPRIDVVVQTSGQFRDLAASRIYLINKAVKLAAEARESEVYENYVRKGVQDAEAMMKEKGLSPVEARELSTIRVFGGLNGGYGASIMGMVENGDSWESEDEVAERYLSTMGAMYGKKVWGDYKPGAFEAALQNTEMVLQPRSANTWGPLSLDHVYEFMGGLSNVIRLVTGKDADGWFSDLRNPNDPKVQSLEDAIWTEARTTLLNPKYITGMQQEGASAAEVFAETFRNTYSWDVMKTSAVDESLWDQLSEVYVDDRYDLGMEDYFREKNPYALQEITAVMLETVRKGYWKPDEVVIRKIANLHSRLVKDFDPGCSGFVCDNAKLREMISEYADPELGETLLDKIEEIRTAAPKENVTGVALEKTKDSTEQQKTSKENTEAEETSPLRILLIVGIVVAVLFSVSLLRKRKSK